MLVCSAPPPARTPSCVASTPKEDSGAAPAGVAKVATEAAPVKAETVRRRRRSIFMTCSADNPEQTVQVSGQEMRAAMAQNLATF
jgi:hypothetical protein